ncbi:MAG: FKBP-type peptidyl-prolyl cis-trans isomerase [bacterium]
MKYALVIALSVMMLACQGVTQNNTQLKTTQDSVSYAIGLNIGKNFKGQKVDVTVDAVAMGIRHVLDSTKALMTDEQAQACMTAFQQRMMAKQEEVGKVAGEKNRKEGEAFLAANKNKEGVKSTASGLQYKVIKMGTGVKPKADQNVSVQYKGMTIDGKEFDSSYKRGEPATFACNQVIKGWTEVLQLMPVGSKWEVFIPSDLAYGERGAGEAIGPNSTLIFEVELLSVK